MELILMGCGTSTLGFRSLGVLESPSVYFLVLTEFIHMPVYCSQEHPVQALRAWYHPDHLLQVNGLGDLEVVWDLVVSSGVTSVVRAFGKLG